VNRGVTQGITVPGLAVLSAGTNYNLRQVDPYHPAYHYGTATVLASLPNIADAYKTEYYGSGAIPDGDKLIFNDMSISNGGKFEAYLPSVAGWDPTVAHQEHRLGISCDVPVNNLPTDRRARFMQICLVNSVQDVHDEIQTLHHYHLKY
jgi:hypothetical protein